MSCDVSHGEVGLLFLHASAVLIGIVAGACFYFKHLLAPNTDARVSELSENQEVQAILLPDISPDPSSMDSAPAAEAGQEIMRTSESSADSMHSADMSASIYFSGDSSGVQSSETLTNDVGDDLGMTKVSEKSIAETLSFATMEDSLDVEYARKNTMDNSSKNDNSLDVRRAHNGSGDGPFIVPDETYMRDAQAAAANEIFSDGGLDFLESAGSRSGVHDSDYMRQSLAQRFDPLVGRPSVLPVFSSAGPQPPPSTKTQQAPSTLMGPPLTVPCAGYKHPNPAQSHAATTELIAQMQQKQNAIRRQQAANTEMKPALPVAPLDIPTQPSSWPNAPVHPHRESLQFVNTMRGDQFNKAVYAQLPVTHGHKIPIESPSALNGSGDYDHSMNGDAGHGGNTEAEYENAANYPPGSLVNLVDAPRRPVTLRTKNHRSASVTKTLNRRSVPAHMFDDRDSFNTAMEYDREEQFLGFPDLPPVWENVVSTYEGVVQTLLAKLKTFQEETAAAKLRETKAIADQEEMHRVFVSLHERFEGSKSVITSYKTNQETLQKAFDDLNAEFQPLEQQMKRTQATNRLNEIKLRALEAELEKKKDENAELTKIVDDLISKA